MNAIKVLLAAGSASALQMDSYQKTATNIGVRFVEDSFQYDTPINSDNIGKSIHIDPTFDVTKFTRNVDKVRPGWSGTRAIWNRDDGDEATEFGAPAAPSGNPYLDAVTVKPCDKQSKEMDQLTTTWMNDPDAEGVAQRLDVMDKQAWAQSAHQASRSTLREFLTDTIDEEVNKFTAEKADEAAFHPEARVPLVTDPDYVPPKYVRYESLA